MARDKRNRTIDRLTHESADERTIDLREDTAAGRALDPITGQPVYTDRPADQDWSDEPVASGDARVDAGPVPPADMPDYPPPHTQIVRERVPEYVAAGAKFSPMALLTGVLVAFGVMMVGAIVAAVVAANTQGSVNTTEELTTLGVGGAVALIGAQFLAYLWGGYTAGRMSRSNGLLHGALVPVLALGIAALITLIVRAAGETPRLVFPSGAEGGGFAVDRATLVEFGAAVGIGVLVAMFVGGLLGGWMGTRWHRKIERRAMGETHYDREYERAS